MKPNKTLRHRTRRAASPAKFLTTQPAMAFSGRGLMKVHRILGLLPVSAGKGVIDMDLGVVSIGNTLLPIVDLRPDRRSGWVDESGLSCILVVETEDEFGFQTAALLIDPLDET